MAVLVIGAALAGIRQHFIGFLALLECDFGLFLVAVVAVGMVLGRCPSISHLEFGFGDGAADAETS